MYEGGGVGGQDDVRGVGRRCRRTGGGVGG